jgi:spermidine/putrescine transport system permease protein
MARISLLDVYPAAPDHVARYGLENYSAFLQSPIYFSAFLRSLRFAAIVTLLSLLVGYPLAYHLAVKTPPEHRARRLLLLVAPFWTSEILRIFAVILLLSNHGAINIALNRAGLTETPLPLLYNAFSVGFGMLYAMILPMLLPLYASLDRLPCSLLDAASDLGVGPWQRFLRVTLPLTAGGAVTGCVLVFLLCLGVFAEPMLLGGVNTTLFSMTIGGFFASSAGRWPLGAAFSLILLVSALVICALPIALVRRRLNRLAV